MKTITFNLPTSIKEVKALIKERSDRRFCHNKKVLDTFAKKVINEIKRDC